VKERWKVGSMRKRLSPMMGTFNFHDGKWLL
jgi:hypothetical protein